MEEFPVWLMCRLIGVSRSGFYSWLARGAQIVSQKRRHAAAVVKLVFEEKRRRYGSPRLFRELKARGFQVGKHMVETTMKELGLVARKRRRFVTTTDSDHGRPIAQNLLARNFECKHRDTIWLSDITYLPMHGGGFIYLCVIMDLASREIVGWQIALSMHAELVCDALVMAVENRGRAPRGAIFHSDQGSQYASESFRKLLNLYGMRQSMSRRGQCWDNAPMESFFSNLKQEYEDALQFENLDDARTGLFEHIEVFYNRSRQHSSIGYITPACYEAESRS
jgi:transposase InsO family protein